MKYLFIIAFSIAYTAKIDCPQNRLGDIYYPKHDGITHNHNCTTVSYRDSIVTTLSSKKAHQIADNWFQNWDGSQKVTLRSFDSLKINN